MRITLSPQSRDDRLTLHRAGDVLTINGQALDFGPLPQGGSLPAAATGRCSLFRLLKALVQDSNQENRAPAPAPGRTGGTWTMCPFWFR